MAIRDWIIAFSSGRKKRFFAMEMNLSDMVVCCIANVKKMKKRSPGRRFCRPAGGVYPSGRMNERRKWMVFANR